ncbi:MAG TPA: endolytic transglycosylase MltG [Nocardioides sp.]|nr:endolytic transglycosylase MltG [Nocardioides sp.]
MTEPSVLPGRAPHSHRARKKRSGCLPILIVLVLVVVAGVLAWNKVLSPWWDDITGGPADYPGPGHGQVMVQITEGESIPQMGAALEKLGVVQSSDAFVDAASANADATGIQAGTYVLKKEMKASDVVAYLADPKHLAQDLVTVPEGMRTSAVLDLLAKHTDFPRSAYEKVLQDPGQLGLPGYAHGDAEGYLFPATYAVTPVSTPATILKAMVDRWHQAADDVGLEEKAKDVGLSPAEVMTVASILEFEAQRDQDYPKVARAIYNRLDDGMALQSDATVAYANGLSGEVFTTDEQRNIDSPYNTYVHTGLPPGPIGNPGEKTIDAALHPADGDWLFWVVVNLRTGKTVFSDTYEEHQAAVEKLRAYCAKSDAC